MDDAAIKDLMASTDEFLRKSRARFSDDEIAAHAAVLALYMEIDGDDAGLADVRAVTAVETFTRQGFRIIKGRPESEPDPALRRLRMAGD